MSKTWKNLQTSINRIEFQAQLKKDLKPERYKHFAVSPNESNSLLTRFRTGRTKLNPNRFTLWTNRLSKLLMSRKLRKFREKNSGLFPIFFPEEHLSSASACSYLNLYL